MTYSHFVARRDLPRDRVGPTAFRLSSGIALSAALLAPAAAPAQHEHGGATPERLGKVHFETSCSESVEKEFDRAIALLHSFWFSAAIDGFNEVLARDPSCAMAHWGIAMSWWSNPFAGMRSLQALASGRAAVEKAKSIPARTERERAYIAAVEALYEDYEGVAQIERIIAYEEAMEAVARDNPEDPEAAIFYALALDQTGTALPRDPSYARFLKAAALLEKEWKRQPDHPGIAHYLIHSYDVPPLAPRALEAARRYAKIAPDAPHALHMPSHTFTRLGYWRESIDTNLASAAAARKDNAASEELHALDYQVYAYLQTAQDRAARKVLEQAPAIGARIQMGGAGNAAPAAAGMFALAAIPARYALERSAWAEAAALEVRATPLPWVDAMTHFARALGAARSGNAPAAAADLERLAALEDALAEDAYWREQVAIQRQAASAWVAFASGKRDEGLSTMRAAAQREDATDKSAITPGPLEPARELLAEMLLDAGRPAEALAEFEKALEKEPNRFRSVYGAARAAEEAGQAAKAKASYAKLVAICEKGDVPGRAELQQARKAAPRAAPAR
jgi:hypothetical protein